MKCFSLILVFIPGQSILIKIRSFLLIFWTKQIRNLPLTDFIVGNYLKQQNWDSLKVGRIEFNNLSCIMIKVGFLWDHSVFTWGVNQNLAMLLHLSLIRNSVWKVRHCIFTLLYDMVPIQKTPVNFTFKKKFIIWSFLVRCFSSKDTFSRKVFFWLTNQFKGLSAEYKSIVLILKMWQHWLLS